MKSPKKDLLKELLLYSAIFYVLLIEIKPKTPNFFTWGQNLTKCFINYELIK